MQILKIVIIIADNNDLLDILIMEILCPNRITNQYSIFIVAGGNLWGNQQS